MKWGLVSVRRTRKAALALCRAILVVGLPAGTPEGTEDANGEYLIGLFNQACVPNRGNTEKIAAFAQDHHFLPVTGRSALDVFVGPGDRGKAWYVPSPTHQHFVLSIRGTTEACVVWAQTADPVFVEAAFRREIEAIGKPGLDVKEQPEETVDTPVGKAKTISYLVLVADTKMGFAFTLTTAERAGGPFQASIQMARVQVD